MLVVLPRPCSDGLSPTERDAEDYCQMSGSYSGVNDNARAGASLRFVCFRQHCCDLGGLNCPYFLVWSVSAPFIQCFAVLMCVAVSLQRPNHSNLCMDVRVHDHARGFHV